MNTHSPAPEIESQESRAARAVALAPASPATQAACEIMRLVRSGAPAAKALRVRFDAANATSGDWWGVAWRYDGHDYRLDLALHGPSTSLMLDIGASIHGDGIVTVDVDGETVLALLVALRRDDPDSRIAVVGASIFEPGLWTDLVIELLQRLQDGADPRTGQKAA
ncbi:hypothetical protein E9232_006860 [Inquilinus ginsengisoli]|uniref:Uncharacterized protein n=1 Tax=Inquilinus ginsengisoli TaxID=363840 RepID=A0ABU1K0B3_9PROT|nr:hypothetical protein [Inquilinus ginsengisoli]MDR6294306.1 hypothetical protein [Inquilinus ginsengisoli]